MKKGLPGCILVIIGIILIGLGIYYIFKFAANVIPQPLALAAAAIGGVCFIIGKIAGLKKSRVKRTDIKGHIVLVLKEKYEYEPLIEYSWPEDK